MKNILSITVITAVFFLAISCTKENDRIASSSLLKSQLETISKSTRTIQGSVNEMSKPFLTQIESKKLNLLGMINSQNNQLNNSNISSIMRPMDPPDWIGPNYVTGSFTKIQSNVELTIPGTEDPTLPTGVYICDVYSYHTDVSLPSNSVARLDLDQMTQYGYSNYTTFVRGVNYIQSTGPTGNIFEMTTYSIVIKYNIIGQAINHVIPYDLTGMEFAYSYLLY